jgi:DNA-binding MarR family transcriptional regulator
VEYSVLSTLYGRQRQTMSTAELSDVIGEAPEHVKRLTLALSLRGLVVRNFDTADRRKVMAGLSDAGVVLIRSILPVVSGMTADLVNSFAPGELATLLALLRKLTRSAA